MDLKTKLELFINKGFTYNPETGICKSHTGKIQNGKTGTKRNYITLSLRHDDKSVNVKAHQFAWYYIHKTIPNQVDHINRNTIDNRICNLRNLTPQQNSFNTNSKCYSYHKRTKKWQVSLGLNYKRIHIGYFDTEDEAKQQAKIAKEKYHKI